MRRGNGGVIGAAVIPSTKTAPGVWGFNELARLAKIGPAATGNYPAYEALPSLADPSFASVVTLLHCDKMTSGRLKASVGPDFQLFSNSAVAAGVAVTGGLTDAVPLFGTYSFLCANRQLDASSPGSIYRFGTSAFTFEFWFHQLSHGTFQNVIDFRTSDTVTPGPAIIINTSAQIRYLATGATNNISSATSAVSVNTWHHLAACRSSGTTYMYLDGVSQGSFVDSTDYNAANNCYFGECAPSTTGQSFNGLLKELRITPGVARYPAGTTFAVPTAPFPDY